MQHLVAAFANSFVNGDRSSTPMQIFHQVVDRVDRRTGDFLSELQSSSPTVATLRDWYRAARELGNALPCTLTGLVKLLMNLNRSNH